MSAEWESRDRERFGPSLVAGMSFGPLCRRSLVALLLVVSTALFPVSLTAAGEDVRSLLEALRIDIPAWGRATRTGAAEGHCDET